MLNLIKGLRKFFRRNIKFYYKKIINLKAVLDDLTNNLVNFRYFYIITKLDLNELTIFSLKY